MKLLICGGRGYTDGERMSQVLDGYLADHGRDDLCVIHGAAPGADTLAAQWAGSRGVAAMAFRAPWDRYGPGAGPMRNRWMLRWGQPDVVVAFVGGRGTASMLREAERVGVPVVKIDWNKT